MTLLPIAQRELIAASRKPGMFRLRMAVAILTSVIAAAVLLASGLGPAASAGKTLFTALVYLAFAFCLLEGIRTASDCISEEKREGTLGLLFLTDLRGYDIIAGKLAFSSLTAVQSLFAFFPVLAICLILGGTTLGEFWRGVAVLTSALFLSLSLALCISTFSRAAHKAMGLTLLLLLGICLAPFLPTWTNWPLPAALLKIINGFSPVLACLLIPDLRYAANARDFWFSLGSIQLASWTCLLVASFYVPRLWQDQPEGTLSEASSTNEPPPGPRARKPSRTRLPLLDHDPIYWLCARNDGERIRGWTLIAAVSLLGVMGCLLLGDWLDSPFQAGSIIITVVLIGLKIWLAAKSSVPLAEAKQNGALELLAATPIRTEQILEGHRAALIRWFLYPVVGLLMLDLCLLGGEIKRQGDAGVPVSSILAACGIGVYELITLVVDLIAISWMGVWMGLLQKNPQQAFFKTLLFAIVIPFLLLCIPNVLIDLVLINIARFRARKDFREYAAAAHASPVPPLLVPKLIGWTDPKPPILPAKNP